MLSLHYVVALSMLDEFAFMRRKKVLILIICFHVLEIFSQHSVIILAYECFIMNFLTANFRWQYDVDLKFNKNIALFASVNTSIIFELNLYWSSFAFFLKRRGFSNFSFFISLRCASAECVLLIPHKEWFEFASSNQEDCPCS